MRNLINVAGFQIVWFACVLSAAAGRQWIGLAVFTAVILLHIVLTSDRRVEAEILFRAALLGALAEWTMTSIGALRFDGLWIVALWVNFAATLRWALAWLQGRYVLGSALGAIAGPLSYLGGERLGAISVHQPWAVALEWAIATPVLLWLAKEKA